MTSILGLIFQLLDIYAWIVIISALISWVPIPRDHPIVQLLHSATEPLYEPIRRVLNPASMGGMDLSPLIVLLGIQLLKQMLAAAL